tara:strand:+ start:1501 stop:1671 length:171 start_codon:yes stop_codon:yes gene_type:complete
MALTKFKIRPYSRAASNNKCRQYSEEKPYAAAVFWADIIPQGSSVAYPDVTAVLKK